jgi:membrane associated rhomboid family serine protease
LAFIPIHDTNRLRYIRWPFVAWGMIAANVIIFFLVEHGSLADADQASVIAYGLIPASVNHIAVRPAEYFAVPDWLTLVTYAFLHGDFWHLAGNMIFLWVFADNVEDSLGHVRFLLFCALCAIGSGYAYVLADPTSESPVVGASGVVAGVVAAYLILHPHAKVWVLALGGIPLRISALWLLGFWILFQVYGVLTAGGEDIAWWSHLGGVLTGGVLVLFLRRRGVPLFDRTPRLPAPPPQVDGGETRR